MHVTVVRDASIPSGTVGLEDRYEYDPKSGSRITEIIVGFHPDDLPAESIPELSVALTVEARRWTEVAATAHTRAELPQPPIIQVRRVPGLPCRVYIEDSLGSVTVLFREDAITEAGARAWQNALIRRSETWVRQEQQQEAGIGLR
ncbi:MULTISPECIES: hypothetical protein [Actinomycetes]|uniref:hypothetical protein n=1 Tax=Actinomycetes TaxID=1760 RepID=UPI0033F6E19A